MEMTRLSLILFNIWLAAWWISIDTPSWAFLLMYMFSGVLWLRSYLNKE
jgi:hypothetical protein